MALSRVGQRYLKIFPSGCKILSCYFSHTAPTESPYWHEIFKDKKIRAFDEIPTVGPVLEEYKNFKIHEAYQRWVLEVGHVVKELFPGDNCCIHIYHDEDFSMVYKNDGRFPLRKSHDVIARYRRDRPHLYNSVGLGAGMGAEWAHLRGMLPHGVGRTIYMPFRPQLEEVADDFINLVQSKLDENSEIEILPYLFRWAFESIGVITLNRRLDALSQVGSEEAENLIKAAHLTNEIIFLANVGDSEKQSYRLIAPQDYFSRIIMEYVADAALEPGSSLVNKLVKEGCDYKDITTLILDLFQGAISTVPLTLTWALYQVSRHPEMQERARKELMKMMPSKDTRFYDTTLEMEKQTLRIADSIRYTRAIIAETLRLCPPAIGNGRIISKDLVLGGYMVPAGNMVVLQSQAACRLEEYFERPLEFIPDRYIDREKYYQKGMVDSPFGIGIRSCIGRAFANAQMNLAFSKILRNFEVSYHHEEVGVINRLHNEPDRPVLFRLKPIPQ
ncbi:cytochrome P450 302a1, mitochondrial [Trichonephila clavata]|uniref:Cytochrome P450 302a1, mitochondrial n=1 Tax=Trichonephila clavata TaxID=2740835 RepID=A0A8X6IHQ0_TRICU|nr:cytochrome P450 302a1, mitochondrial [Trichonephila clavata]